MLIQFAFVSAISLASSTSVGILYEVWHSKAAQAMASQSPQLTTELVIQSEGNLTLDMVYNPKMGRPVSDIKKRGERKLYACGLKKLAHIHTLERSELWGPGSRSLHPVSVFSRCPLPCPDTSSVPSGSPGRVFEKCSPGCSRASHPPHTWGSRRRSGSAGARRG